MLEEWRAIPAWPAYEASSLGRIRRDAKIIAANVPHARYPRVALWRGGRPTTVNVHVLVASAFLGPRPTPKHVVAHLDGVRTNPAAANLAWKTQAENMADAINHGTIRRGSDHHAARLKPSQVAAIRSVAGRMTNASIAAIAGVSETAVRNIIRGHSWGHTP